MSLVAYDNSDVSSDEEEEEDNIIQESASKSFTKAQVDKNNDSESGSIRSDSKAGVDEIDSPNVGRVLPKPKGSNVSFLEEDITKRLMFSSSPLKNSSSRNKCDESLKNRKSTNAIPSSAAKRTVKITLPSLSEFSDDEEESKPKKLKPSAKGSGLFALLPAPKNLVVKENNRKLIPRVVTKPPVPKKNSGPPNIPKKNKSDGLINYPDSGEESGEDENEGIDFFSLTKSTPEIVCPNPNVSNELLNVNEVENTLPEAGTSSTCSEILPPTSDPIFPQKHPSEQNDDIKLPEAPTDVHEENILQLDNDAIHRLCGRRGRGEIIEAQVIDVSGETHLPDPKEWLTKQFTEEQETRSHSHRKRDGPTTQQRRKHQITYLAFQAKERELELKNQWAQNKMSRKQTQAKYGF